MKMMSDLQDAVDACVARLSELSTGEVDHMVRVLERGYVHAMVEQNLRSHEAAVGVSRLTDRLPKR